MHGIRMLDALNFIFKFTEVNISLNSTIKFAKCNNINCNLIFPFNPHEFHGDTWILCPSCRKKSEDHHLIECRSCESVVNFFITEPSENPVVFTVETCSYCSGSSKDESHFLPLFYTERFM